MVPPSFLSIPKDTQALEAGNRGKRYPFQTNHTRLILNRSTPKLNQVNIAYNLVSIWLNFPCLAMFTLDFINAILLSMSSITQDDGNVNLD